MEAQTMESLRVKTDAVARIRPTVINMHYMCSAQLIIFRLRQIRWSIFSFIHTFCHSEVRPHRRTEAECGLEETPAGLVC